MFSCVLFISTTKRPVPLEHCLFYSGEFYKVCENEAFIPQGWKAAKDAYKRKNLSAASGATGSILRQNGMILPCLINVLKND